MTEEMRDLARAYSDALRDVPENPEHHPEGTTLRHVKLVRKSVRSAADKLMELKGDPVFGDILSNLDFSLSESEIQVLNLASWLHDIGKSTATTVDGTPFRDAPSLSGKIQAIGHETPRHYQPQIDALLPMAPKPLAAFYDSNRDMIHFLIERHMDFAHGGFPNRIVSEFFENGRVKGDQRMKLLLVLMWADKMGRAKEPSLDGNLKKLKDASDKSRLAHAKPQKSSKAFEGSEEDFRAMLASRGLAPAAVDAAARAKFAKVQS